VAELEKSLAKTTAEKDQISLRLSAAVRPGSASDVLEVVGVPAGDEIGLEDDVTDAEPLGGKEEESEAELVTLDGGDGAAPEPEMIVEDPTAIDEDALLSLEIGEPVPDAPPAPPMVAIPRGRFVYGEAGSRDADPKTEIDLPAYSIDVYPVTNRDYAAFVRATGRPAPDHWKAPQPPEEIADHPVVWVTWQDATDYATWAGKRLPTRAEWQKAARGTDGRPFPWGSQPDVSRCNCKESGPGATTPVGRYEKGVSPFGLFDAAGNVAEWVAGEIHMPGADARQKVRAVCSGSWRDPLERSRCASRRGYPDGGKAPYVGFRCARD
jgi:formylglycine-generating enzyme required for sulfatase activity